MNAGDEEIPTPPQVQGRESILDRSAWKTAQTMPPETGAKKKMIGPRALFDGSFSSRESEKKNEALRTRKQTAGKQNLELCK